MVYQQATDSPPTEHWQQSTEEDPLTFLLTCGRQPISKKCENGTDSPKFNFIFRLYTLLPTVFF